MRRALSALVLGFSLLFSPKTPAQPTSKPPPANEEEEKAKKLFFDAEAYYRLQEYERALSLYRDAYLLSREPGLLFNIGQCQRHLGRYEEAIKSYKLYLSDNPQTPYRAQVEKLILQTEDLIARRIPEPLPDTNPVSPTTHPAAPDPAEPLSQPASEPLSQPASLLTKAPGEDNPARPPDRRASLFYGASGLCAIGGLTAGSLGLVSFLTARQSEAPDPARAFRANARAGAFGQSATLLAGAALVGGGLGVILRRDKETKGLDLSSLLYGAAGASAISGVAVAVLMLRSASRSKKATGADPELVLREGTRARAFGNVADALFGAALLSGGAGLLLGRSPAPTEPAVALSPSGVVVKVRF